MKTLSSLLTESMSINEAKSLINDKLVKSFEKCCDSAKLNNKYIKYLIDITKSDIIRNANEIINFTVFKSATDSYINTLQKLNSESANKMLKNIDTLKYLLKPIDNEIQQKIYSWLVVCPLVKIDELLHGHNFKIDSDGYDIRLIFIDDIDAVVKILNSYAAFTATIKGKDVIVSVDVK